MAKTLFRNGLVLTMDTKLGTLEGGDVLIEDDKDITEAAEIMDKSHIKKLPVVSGRSLVGILTASDLASAQPKLIEKISKLMVFPKTRKNVAG